MKNYKLPIVIFTPENLNPNTESWISTCQAVREAMEEFSSFIAVYDDGVDSGSEAAMNMSSVFSSVKEAFDLPRETKLLSKSEFAGFGYSSDYPRSLHETIAIPDSTAIESVQSFANLMWPFGNDQFCEKIHWFTTQASELGQLVTRMIFEGYNVGKYCDSHLQSTSYLLRANSYGVPKANDTNVGINPHSDTTFLTILKQNEVQGLEVQYSKDATWIPVHFPPSSFAIMAGDALPAWSNGRIRACQHRVIMGEKPRISIGLFSFQKGMVHVREELAGDDGLLQFHSFDHFGLLKFRTRNPHLSPEERVKAYCGVQKHS